ncbi:MAG: aldehyde ferredoxin oxidoreductase family protein [Halanaeroarchaeum sp.]
MLHNRGPLLTIDLDERSVTETDIASVNERYIGGRGVATKLAHDRIPFDVDPLGPANRLVFTSGPMQSSNMSFTGRMNVTGVSPLTDGLLSSNAGGYLSRNFVATGYSAVELVGESDDLVAVHVTDEGVEFESVEDLAGATVTETVDALEEGRGVGDDQTAVIGPAGENLVRFAAIMTSKERAFGRGGLGAVLGAKNVKALTFDGDSSPEIEIDATQMEVHREAATTDHVMTRQGTTAMVGLTNEMDGFPSYYFSEQHFDGAEGIDGAAVESKKYKKGTCSKCAFACKLPTRDEDRGLETEGPEYEVTMSFGSNSGVDDIVDVMQSNKLCDDLGLDAISAGNTIAAYLMAEDEFGNAELIWELIEKVAHREGVGDTLAEGIDRIHEDLGVENWSVKGMDFAAHEGRVLNGQGLSYAVSNRGADHLYTTFYSMEYPLVDKEDAVPPEGTLGKIDLLIERENLMALADSGVVCKFSRDFMNPDRYETLFDAPYDDLLAVGSRTVTLERHFNNERGFDRSDDVLPYDLPDFGEALDRYYDARGMTDDGVVPDGAVP